MKSLKDGENMIIWIDGTYGVGKTSVARRMKEMLASSGVELLESDVYYNKMIKCLVEEAKRKNIFPSFTGMMPQNDIRFIVEFREVIQQILNENKDIIVDMSLTREECKSGLLEYFVNNNKKVLHIILMANEESLKIRIKNDKTRDRRFALENLQDNIFFLNTNYPDAIRIDTYNRSVDDIANEIITYFSSIVCEK